LLADLSKGFENELLRKEGEMSSSNVEYGQPMIVDYGDLKELTEACIGTGSDGSSLVGLASAETADTSSYHCVTTHK
jgi:hypothetical protein